MKIIKTFESFNQYKTGDIFSNIEEKKLCWKINQLKDWLVKDLGMRYIIDDLLKEIKQPKDFIEEYQPVLKVLYDTGKYSDIKVEGGQYTHYRLKDNNLVFDENGDYHYVNKLNTNYSDIAELITDMLIKSGRLNDTKHLSTNELKTYLLSIKTEVKTLIENNVDDILSFTRNSKGNTKRGDEAEDYACEVMEKFGMEKIYQGGNGDFIDMIFGIDLVMKYKNRVITCQVKSNETLAKRSTTNNYYRRIDYFISPINGIGSGIIIYNREGKSFKIDDNGEVKKES